MKMGRASMWKLLYNIFPLSQGMGVRQTVSLYNTLIKKKGYIVIDIYIDSSRLK